MNLPLFAGIFVAVFLLSLGGTRWALGYLKQRAILDHPNARSSHTIPTPRGGGLAVSTVLIAAWAVLALTGFGNLPQILSLCAAAFGLAVLSWWDDLRPLPASLRLVGQAVAVGIALIYNSYEASYFGGFLPPWLDTVAAGILWIWFLNLFNFMDGIDGMAGIEVVTVSAIGALLAITSMPEPGDWVAPLVMAAATLGFLIWNWPPAQIFMGDAGSGFLGLALGTLLLQAAWTDGRLFWSWLILLAVFETDATVTLLRRLVRRVPHFWRAHRQHAYQRATTLWGGHRPVTIAVGVINVCWLFPLALLVARGWMDGPTGLMIACAPLAILALRLGAGAAEPT